MRHAGNPGSVDLVRAVSIRSRQNPLPPGFEERCDPESGRKYYINHATRETSWTRPRAANDSFTRYPSIMRGSDANLSPRGAWNLADNSEVGAHVSDAGAPSVAPIDEAAEAEAEAVAEVPLGMPVGEASASEQQRRKHGVFSSMFGGKRRDGGGAASMRVAAAPAAPNRRAADRARGVRRWRSRGRRRRRQRGERGDDNGRGVAVPGACGGAATRGARCPGGAAKARRVVPRSAAPGATGLAPPAAAAVAAAVAAVEAVAAAVVAAAARRPRSRSSSSSRSPRSTR